MASSISILDMSNLTTSAPPAVKDGYVSQVELGELMGFCHSLFARHRSIDYYATTIGIGLVIVFGVLGNAGTLLTLSGRRLTTATFVYYRAIACTDLIRCVFVLSYVLRVVIPFRHYYGATWYEAHLMYFIINTLSFVSTSLAVTLCVRLCIGILQSRRLKKTKTNPKTTRIFVYLIVFIALVVNCCLCYEYEAVNSIDYCVRNRTVHPGEYMIHETAFHIKNEGLLKAIHVFPIVILLVLICGAASILACCFFAMPKSSRKSTGPPSNPIASGSSNALLVHHCPSIRQSRPWRTQRQLCKLFLLLSLCYALGLLPGFLNMVMFSKGEGCNNCTSTSENYKTRIRQHFDRANSAAVSNIFQNIGHALSFYVYIVCSDAFRGEFLVKLRRLKSRLFATIWPYSRALGCTSLGALVSEKMSQSSDTKQALRSVTLLAELESEEGVMATFAPQQVVIKDQAAMETLFTETTLAAAAVSYTHAPIFTVADTRRMSTHLHTTVDGGHKKDSSDKMSSSGDIFFDDPTDATTSATVVFSSAPPIASPPPPPISPVISSGDCDQSLPAGSEKELGKSEILSPVQLQPHRYQRFYSSDGKKRDVTN